MMEQSRAVLLRRRRYSENGLILIWFTERHGKVRTAAPGATKPGASLAGRLELFTEAEIAFRAPRSGDLHTLSEITNNPAPPLPSTYRTMMTASYFAELCDRCTEVMDPIPEVFSLLIRAWGYLREKDPETKAVLHFETQLAKALGVHDPKVSSFWPLGALFDSLPRTREKLLILLSRSIP